MENEPEGTWNLIISAKGNRLSRSALEKRINEIASFAKLLARRFHGEYDGWGYDMVKNTIEIFIFEIPGDYANAQRAKACVKKKFPKAQARIQYSPSYGEMERAMPKGRRGR